MSKLKKRCSFINFIDLFSGIGGFRLGLENAGHKCIAFCEIDKFARKTYKANFNTTEEIEWHDIQKITDKEIMEFGKRNKTDIICGGFPCQSFSIAGNRQGFRDKKRGPMFFEIMRFAKILKPKYLLFENVKGLLNHENGETFKTILSALDELGYNAEWQLFNSKNYGVPQNRERVFIIGHLRGESTGKIFPIRSTGTNNTVKLKSLTKGAAQGYRVYSPNGLSITLASQAGGLGAKTGLYVFPTLTPNRINKRQNGRRFKNNNDPMFTLTAQDRHGVLLNNSGTIRIRRLTPLECFRLQGFPDSFYYNAKNAGISDTQLYKQTGNSVTVNVVYAIASSLI